MQQTSAASIINLTSQAPGAGKDPDPSPHGCEETAGALLKQELGRQNHSNPNQVTTSDRRRGMDMLCQCGADVTRT